MSVPHVSNSTFSEIHKGQQVADSANSNAEKKQQAANAAKKEVEKAQQAANVAMQQAKAAAKRSEKANEEANVAAKQAQQANHQVAIHIGEAKKGVKSVNDSLSAAERAQTHKYCCKRCTKNQCLCAKVTVGIALAIVAVGAILYGIDKSRDFGFRKALHIG